MEMPLYFQLLSALFSSLSHFVLKKIKSIAYISESVCLFLLFTIVTHLFVFLKMFPTLVLWLSLSHPSWGVEVYHQISGLWPCQRSLCFISPAAIPSSSLSPCPFAPPFSLAPPHLLPLLRLCFSSVFFPPAVANFT